jgi:hypothetical protein
MLNQICLTSVLAGAGMRLLLTGLRVVFVGRIIAALISLVTLVYILAALLARLLCAFVAAGVRHFDSPWQVNAFYARRVHGL